MVCQSVVQPSTAEYWHIGAITMRFARTSPLTSRGSNNFDDDTGTLLGKDNLNVSAWRCVPCQGKASPSLLPRYYTCSPARVSPLLMPVGAHPPPGASSPREPESTNQAVPSKKGIPLLQRRRDQTIETANRCVHQRMSVPKGVAGRVAMYGIVFAGGTSGLTMLIAGPEGERIFVGTRGNESRLRFTPAAASRLVLRRQGLAGPGQASPRGQPPNLRRSHRS